MPHPHNTPGTMNILNILNAEWIRTQVSETEPCLVIFDVLRDIHSADEQDSTSMKIVMDTLGLLVKGRCALIVHHSSKIHPDMPLRVVNASRGSSYIAGKVDSIWLLHKDTLSIVPRFDKPSSIRLKREQSGFVTPL